MVFVLNLNQDFLQKRATFIDFVLSFSFIYFVKTAVSKYEATKQKRKFSSFFKSLVIELDKDLYGPDNHLVEVRKFLPFLVGLFGFCWFSVLLEYFLAFSCF